MRIWLCFGQTLKFNLKMWVQVEAPSLHNAMIVEGKDSLAALEARLGEGDGSAQREIDGLVTMLLRAIAKSAVQFVAVKELVRLRGIVEDGNEMFKGMYEHILEHQVKTNEFFDDFCDKVGALKVDASRFPQRTADLTELYSAAHEVQPTFETVLREAEQRARPGNGGQESMVRLAPLKKRFRVVQKMATRIDGLEPGDFRQACDIVRGSIVCETMGHLLGVLLALHEMQAEGTIIIVRTKSRFMVPTAGGWADAMLNFICPGAGGAAGQHVCELQLSHATMLKARKEFGGHKAYAAFREAMELLEHAVIGGLLQEVNTVMKMFLSGVSTAEAAADEAASVAVKQGCCRLSVTEAAARVKSLVENGPALQQPIKEVLEKLNDARTNLPAGSEPGWRVEARLKEIKSEGGAVPGRLHVAMIRAMAAEATAAANEFLALEREASVVAQQVVATSASAEVAPTAGPGNWKPPNKREKFTKALQDAKTAHGEAQSLVGQAFAQARDMRRCSAHWQKTNPAPTGTDQPRGSSVDDTPVVDTALAEAGGVRWRDSSWQEIAGAADLHPPNRTVKRQEQAAAMEKELAKLADVREQIVAGEACVHQAEVDVLEASVAASISTLMAEIASVEQMAVATGVDLAAAEKQALALLDGSAAKGADKELAALNALVARLPAGSHARTAAAGAAARLSQKRDGASDRIDRAAKQAMAMSGAPVRKCTAVVEALEETVDAVVAEAERVVTATQPSATVPCHHPRLLLDVNATAAAACGLEAQSPISDALTMLRSVRAFAPKGSVADGMLAHLKKSGSRRAVALSRVRVALKDAHDASRFMLRSPKPRAHLAGIDQELFDAARVGDVKEATRLLTQESACPNDYKSSDGSSALLEAVASNHVAVVKLLLHSHGADVNVKKENGDTALLLAARQNKPEIARLLCLGGADLDAMDDVRNTALSVAAKQGCVEVANILVDAGCEVNNQGAGLNTPLILAAENEHPEIVRLLVDFGANVNIQNRFKVRAYRDFAETEQTSSPPSTPHPTICDSFFPLVSKQP